MRYYTLEAWHPGSIKSKVDAGRSCRLCSNNTYLGKGTMYSAKYYLKFLNLCLLQKAVFRQLYASGQSY